MKDPLRHVKPAVRALQAYTLAARQAPVKINQNENPFELPDWLKRRVVERALQRPWARYPEFDPRELLGALGRHAGWRADGVMAGNGSNELIEALLRVTVAAGVRVAIPEPTFTLYALLTRILGGEVVSVPLGAGFEYDAQALARAEAALTIVCSPNNPTGTAMSVDEVSRLCAQSEGLVVVDEAYHEFSGRCVVALLAEHRNLVVLRTFSKAMAMAGLRVGYLLAAPELVREIDKARLPYNINLFSQLAALEALEQPGALRTSVELLRRLRDDLFAALDALPGVRPVRSEANFILFELEAADPKEVFEALYRDGVLVRDVTSYERLGRALRVSVGSQEENARFLASLQAALQAASAELAR